MLHHLTSMADDIGCSTQILSDGSVQFVKEKTACTFNALEMAQIERGLIDTKAVKKSLEILFLMGEVFESAMHNTLDDPDDRRGGYINFSRN